MPQISIITVVYNAVETLPSCINSVAGQNVNAEHIVVDGQSNDGTQGILEVAQLDGKIRYISEPDDGIYDAMNKGLRMAQGEIIGILNADDLYASPDVLQQVIHTFTDTNIDSCYGDLVYTERYDTDTITRYWKAGKFRRNAFYNGWMPPHPTFFVRRHIYEKYGLFNLNLGTAADYELMLRFLFKHRVSSHYIPSLLIKMRNGGASNATVKNRLVANRMDREAWRINRLQPRPWTLWAKPARKIGQFLLKKTHRVSTSQAT